MFDFIKVNNPTELIAKFNASWIATIGLTASHFDMSYFYPVISQLGLICTVQFVAFFVDYARLKFLKQRKDTTINEINQQIDSKIENSK